jgi:hypothetical protein
MKLTAIVLSSVIIPVFLVTGYSWAKSDDPLIPTSEKRFAYFVEEVYPDEKSFSHSGFSSSQENNQIIADLGIEKYPEDRASSFPEASLAIGGKITLLRAPVFNIVDGKKQYQVRSWQENVGGLLTEKSINLGEEDKINFSKDTEIFDGMTIKIIRVARTRVYEYEDIDFDVIEKKDPELEKGKTRIERAGVLGEKKYTYEVIREDGEEVSKTLVSTEVTKEPVDKILIVGTKIISYGTGVASWYTSSTEMIAACNIVSRGNYVRVVSLANGKEVTVKIVGGGLRSDRIIDLSTAAFQALGASLGQGVISSVRLEKVY